MEIFGIGLPELLIIAIVALVVLGPDRLPEAFRALGKGVGDIRRALEPARSAWAEVQREINSATQIPAPTSTSESSGTKPAGNPWEVHPLAEGLSPEERERFFASGELPEWRLREMEKREADNASPNGVAFEDLPELDYPMPHEPAAQEESDPKAALEELYYPAPEGAPKEGQEA